MRRTDCLESMGLAQVVYEGVNPQSKGLRQWAEAMGISPEEAVEAISLLLDNWRRSRYLYVTDDPIFSRYHAKDDPYIQAGLLNLRDFHPQGLLLISGRTQTSYARGLLAQRGASAVQALVKKWASHPNTTRRGCGGDDALGVPDRRGQGAPQGDLRSQRETPLPTCGRVDLEKFVVEPSQVKERCTTCQRITTRQAPELGLHPPQLPRHDRHRAARPGELRRLADGATVRDGQRRGTHRPGARRGPQQDRAGLQVEARQDQLPGRHADAGDGRQHRGPRHGPDAERPATAVELLAAGRAGGS